MQNSTLQKKQPNKIGKHWRQDGTDFMCTLGKYNRAIVIRLFINKLIATDKWYSIAQASWLPFTEEEYDKRFDTAQEAIIFSENIVKEWVQSLFVEEEQPSFGMQQIEITYNHKP